MKHLELIYSDAEDAVLVRLNGERTVKTVAERSLGIKIPAYYRLGLALEKELRAKGISFSCFKF